MATATDALAAATPAPEAAAPAAASPRAYAAACVAYLVPSFAIAAPWHMALFAPAYDQLQIYRDDFIMPLGLLSMLVQGVLFAVAYPRLIDRRRGVLAGGLRFGLGAGLLAWSYTVLPVAAKFPMTSVAGFVGLESAFTAVQWLVAGPMIAWAHARFAA